MITIVSPLGYCSVVEEIPVSLSVGDIVGVDFSLACQMTASDPRSIGFWKHQIGVALGGKGKAIINAPTLCDYLNLIENHFNTNEINQVVVYEPPVMGSCSDCLEVAKNLLNLQGNSCMLARARQQLMALLMNVSAGYIGLWEIVSLDGATLSQAITYCDQLIDSPNGDYELAKTIADEINNGRQVEAGLIPLNIANIAYKNLPKEFMLTQNHPNPFNPSTRIVVYLPKAAHVELSVFNITGEKVITLVDDLLDEGEHAIVWNGRNSSGDEMATGIYFYRLQADDFADTKKMILLK